MIPQCHQGNALRPCQLPPPLSPAKESSDSLVCLMPLDQRVIQACRDLRRALAQAHAQSKVSLEPRPGCSGLSPAGSWVLKTSTVVLWLSITSPEASPVREQPHPWRALVGESQVYGLGCTSCRRELPLHPPRLGVAPFSLLSCFACLATWATPWRKDEGKKDGTYEGKMLDTKMAFLQSITYCHRYLRSRGA